MSARQVEAVRGRAGAGRRRRPRRMRPETEGLEPRITPADLALGTFAVVQGLAAEAQPNEPLRLNITPEQFRFNARHSVLVKLTAEGTGPDGEPLEIGRATRSGPAGRGGLAFQRPLGPGSALIGFGAGHYTVPLAGGTAGALPGYAVELALAGDVNGDFRVDRIDLELLRLARRDPSVLTPEQYAAADIDNTGRVDLRDVRVTLFNFGAATTVRPLALTVELDRDATPNRDGQVIRTATATFDVTSQPGAVVQVTNRANGSGDGVIVGDNGRADVDLAMALGENSLLARSTDSFGQVVYATAEVTRLRTPLVVLPGYLGSMPTGVKNPNGSLNLARFLEFGLQRGFPRDQLELAPDFDIGGEPFDSNYPELIDGLVQGGYTQGVDLFLAPYDWRLDVAPTDASWDGRLSNVTAEAIASPLASFPFALGYLGDLLAEMVQADPSIGAVDLLGHSNGTIMARAYAQSLAPGGTFNGDDGQAHRLPTVNRLLLAAPPNFGASEAWNLWNNNLMGYSSGAVLNLAITGVVMAWASRTEQDPNYVLPGPDYNLRFADFFNEQTSTIEYGKIIQAYFPSLRSLLPTYDFLITTDNQLTNINDDPTTRSNLLLDLNGGSGPASNPWLANVGHAYITYGAAPADPQTGALLPTFVLDQTRIGPPGEVWPLGGNPKPVDPGQTWYQNIAGVNQGDTTVPLISLQAYFPGDPRATVQVWGNPQPNPPFPYNVTNGEVTHVGLLANPDFLAWLNGVLASG